MPQLIKKVEGEIYVNIVGNISYLSPIIGEIQGEDYINLNGFIAYLQNFSKVETSEKLTKPINFGLINKNKIPMVTIEISY